MRNRRLSAANRRRDPLGAGLYLFRCAARFPPCIAPFALTIYGPICSGRRWIDLADPAESSALANGYAALLHDFPAPCAGLSAGDRGIMPLDQLAATVRSVAETWSRGHQAAEAAEFAAAGHVDVRGLGRPRRTPPSPQADAHPGSRPCGWPRAAMSSTHLDSVPSTASPLPLPPTLPTLVPCCPFALVEPGPQEFEHRDRAGFGGAKRACLPRAPLGVYLGLSSKAVAVAEANAESRGGQNDAAGCWPAADGAASGIDSDGDCGGLGGWWGVAGHDW